MANPTTRMNNRKPVDTTDKAQAQQQAESHGHASPKDQAAAIDAAEHGKSSAKPGSPGQQR